MWICVARLHQGMLARHLKPMGFPLLVWHGWKLLGTKFWEAQLRSSNTVKRQRYGVVCA